MLVRKAEGIETAGSLNILFSDKTGTITKGHLEVVEFFTADGVAIPLDQLAQQTKLKGLIDLAIGKNSQSMYDGSGRVVGGNATDQALMRFLGQETFHKLDEVSSYAVTKSQSFNSANKFSQAYIAGAGRTFYKGAPEKFLAVAQKYLSLDGDEHPLDLESLNAKIDELAGKSMRVLAFGYSPSEMTENAINADTVLIGLVGIRDDQLDKSPFELSGGQKRRVALAGVMAMDPQVLVLDEPTAGLDPAGRENLMANIRDYHRNKKRTIILVSHSMDEIARNVDRILVLKSAHVLMSGTPAEVFARAEELLSAGLDVPQVTRIAMRLREQGLAIDPAVYTVEALERELLALRRGETGC